VLGIYYALLGFEDFEPRGSELHMHDRELFFYLSLMICKSCSMTTQNSAAAQGYPANG
jgi:hypothetical protein